MTKKSKKNKFFISVCLLCTNFSYFLFRNGLVLKFLDLIWFSRKVEMNHSSPWSLSCCLSRSIFIFGFFSSPGHSNVFLKQYVHTSPPFDEWHRHAEKIYPLRLWLREHSKCKYSTIQAEPRYQWFRHAWYLKIVTIFVRKY